ncbi:Transcriptional regulator, LysR family [Desulfamplus magnetovallimortis]|uniref:Transcriptional regulator, LysR family n=1 Tax=Desulfamplus magnetovallimortis TaxID=1246637 RepID=A0A1W1H761_9BACT|nr:LysR family transcriptional regulator [Desulfamplus magnetovallimortis]SLM28297.1 Transcriptional regulator, LysR family [Desulfamplus magnetovallimortis]
MKLRSAQWIVDDEGKTIMGNGRLRIFENIEVTGSINKAAKKMKMSYKAVWSKIKATETHYGKQLVIADKKDGSHLTEDARELLEKFRTLKERCRTQDDMVFDEIFSD